MNELKFPYDMVRDNLGAALAKVIDMPRKSAIDWQLINIIEKANNLLENRYFEHPVIDISNEEER